MDNSIIIVLGMILLILIILNHLTIITVDTTHQEKPMQGSCAQTVFGCCPDGVNSKINFYGTNCPGYKPIPGYPLQPQPQNQNQNQNQMIGGCSGTRYGCCPDNYTAKIDVQGSNCSH
jgi:hypothetical protein